MFPDEVNPRCSCGQVADEFYMMCVRLDETMTDYDIKRSWSRMDLVSLCQEPGLAAEVVAFLSLRDAGPQGPAWPPRASSLSYHARRCSEYSAGKWRRVR